MYGEAAVARRQCTATTRAGARCRAWACWDDPAQRCRAHAPGAHTPPGWKREKTKYPPCTCPAYAWPHRPGGGLCRWPEPPLYRRTTPAGTHAWPCPRR